MFFFEWSQEKRQSGSAFLSWLVSPCGRHGEAVGLGVGIEAAKAHGCSPLKVKIIRPELLAFFHLLL
jgi:hypothetical protein